MGSWSWSSSDFNAQLGEANKDETGLDLVFGCYQLHPTSSDFNSNLVLAGNIDAVTAFSFSAWRGRRGKLSLDVSGGASAFNRVILNYNNTHGTSGSPSRSFSAANDAGYGRLSSAGASQATGAAFGCSLSVEVELASGQVFSVLRRQSPASHLIWQTLVIDLHPRSKAIHFIEDGDCVFYVNQLAFQRVPTVRPPGTGLELSLNETQAEEFNATLGIDLVLESTLEVAVPASDNDRLRNFFRLGVVPLSCVPQLDVQVLITRPGLGPSLQPLYHFATLDRDGVVAASVDGALDTLTFQITRTIPVDQVKTLPGDEALCEVTASLEAFPVTLPGIEWVTGYGSGVLVS